MSSVTPRRATFSARSIVVPGAGTTVTNDSVDRQPAAQQSVRRDPARRDRYLRAALAEIPRLLGAIDRNPYRPTYGCLDRQFWHYRTASFPSEMYQEGALPLALVYALKLPGNRWQGNDRVRELAIAAIRFAAQSSHRDGSCDDYYPFERALGAAVFSLQATAEAYRLLDLADPEMESWFERRARWVIDHDESGRLANHQALAALGLFRVAEITGKTLYRQAARSRLDTLLSWQNDEGWFEEYGGADPGYQTVTIDCLAKIRRTMGSAALGNVPVDESLRRAVTFARHFLHPDGSYGGEYGSRGTYHFYPHGVELLAGQNAEAADLADGFLDAMAAGRTASFGDDRMFIHRLANLIEAYIDWAPSRPNQPSCPPDTAAQSPDMVRYLPNAQLLVRRAGGPAPGTSQTVVSAARGGLFKHFGQPDCSATDGSTLPAAVTDSGLIVETTDGRLAVSQMHQTHRDVDFVAKTSGAKTSGAKTSSGAQLSVAGSLHWSSVETATPIKQAVFHAGMACVGRWCRDLVRRLLQRRLITGRSTCGIRLTRVFEFGDPAGKPKAFSLRVTDTIELSDPRVKVGRMAFGTDHQMAYVAASGVYQESVLSPWTDLESYVDEINAARSVTIVRTFE